MAVVY